MAKQTLGVGIIGTGFGKLVHLPGFLSLEKARVVGIASKDPEKSRRLAQEFSLPRHFTTWQELVDCSEIRAVAIAGPNELHAEMAQRAFAAGKAVLCEKPLALDLAEAKSLCEAARRSQQVHMVNFLFREHPAFQEGREILQSGSLGAPLYATVEFTTSSGPPNLSWTWRSDKRGGGILAILGVHSLDYIPWLLGPVRAVSAYAGTRVAARFDEASKSLKPVTSEDCVQAVLELANGAPVSLVVSSLASAGRRHGVEVVCERGTLRIINDDERDMNRFDLWVAQPGRRFEKMPLEVDEPGLAGDSRLAMFRRLAHRFLEAIGSERLDAEPSFFDGYRAQRLMAWISSSHRERRWLNADECPE